MCTKQGHYLIGNYAFTLLELIITATLLGFILLILFSIYPNSIMAIRHGEHRLTAANFAQSLLEKKRAAPFIEIAEAPVPLSISGEDETIYTASFDCFDVPNTDSAKLKGIRVIVSWEERDNNKYSVTKECYVCSVLP